MTVFCCHTSKFKFLFSKLILKPQTLFLNFTSFQALLYIYQVILVIQPQTPIEPQLILCQQSYFTFISFVSLYSEENYLPVLSFLYLALVHLTQTWLTLFLLPTPYGLFNNSTFIGLTTATISRLLQLWL